MTFDTTLIAALITAGSVVGVAVFTALYNKRAPDKSSVEKARLESHLRQEENLHNKKIALYPEAFAITEKLSKNIILTSGCSISPAYFRAVKDELITWSHKCGPVFGDETLKSYRALLEALSLPAKHDGDMSRQSRNQIWRCKNRFRGCVKKELQP